MPTVIESNGLTSLVQVGANYFLYPVGTSSGPLLKISGAAVTMGQFGPWTPIGAEQVGSGYQVAWQFGTADQYIVWTLDSTGNFLSQGAVTSGNSLAFESLEASFQQNLNHDLATGIVTTVIESNGSTSLAQVANTYSLSPGGGAPDLQLRFGGAAVTTGEFGAWTPIGAEQVAGGYQVAWQFGTADQYIVWNVDSTGNFLSQGAVLSGISLALETLETTFQQDLNHDLATGVVTTVIESNGSTSLAQVANTYSLSQGGGASGLQLRFGGAAVTTGEFGAWTPIGAEQVGTGYQVAWQFGTADQYIIWNVDSTGNFLSQGAVLSGISLALESLETTFQQDLNHDLTTGIVTTVIESNGSTSLVHVANNYFLHSGGGSPDLELSAFGAPVTTGEFGAFNPIAAEATASGYEVAWKAAGADQYTVLNADSNGTFVSHAFFVVSGNSYALQSLEASFQQDVNGDGRIGPLTTVIEFGWIDQPGPGRGRLFSEYRRLTGSAAALFRRRRRGGPIRCVDADRRGAGRKRVPGRLEERRCRSISFMDGRRQRQLHHPGRRRVRKHVVGAIVRARPPPGPQQ